MATNHLVFLSIYCLLIVYTTAALLNPAGKTSPLLRGGGCPLCDSSVYSYCDYKLTHDSCCCTTGSPYAGVGGFGGGVGGFGGFGGGVGGYVGGVGGPFGKNAIARNGLPFQCQYNDCSFLYANTCIEMALIRDCCCNSPYR